MDTRRLIALVFKDRMIVSYDLLNIKRINDDTIQGTNDDTIQRTNDEIALLEKYADMSVSEQKLTDYYFLLKRCPDSLVEIIESGYALARNYPTLNECANHEQFVYTLNFDDDTFNVNGEPVGQLSNMTDKWI